ncbi:MAG: hypothetical protein HAW62_01355 [Endozoicomonadaceae bacterium]|nr:hypothetical protein [Endozoicomonadaceae bacterium]
MSIINALKEIEVLDKKDNPIIIEGIDFIEFSSVDPDQLVRLFECFGFLKMSHSINGQITHYQQGQINLLLTRDLPFNVDFTKAHGDSICSIGLRVRKLNEALEYFRQCDITVIFDYQTGLPFPSLENIGGSRLYLMDAETPSFYTYYPGFKACNSNKAPVNLLQDIDHLAYNVYPKMMDTWINHHLHHLNFKFLQPFNIHIKNIQLFSKVIQSKNNKVVWSINEAKNNIGQIADYLKKHQGPGVQHIALNTDDIFKTMDYLCHQQIEFMMAPDDAYYDELREKLPKSMISFLPLIKKYRLLIDIQSSDRLLFQVFTKPIIGPIFIEIIQRVKGYQGFGEKNVKTLFECMENTI